MNYGIYLNSDYLRKEKLSILFIQTLKFSCQTFSKTVFTSFWNKKIDIIFYLQLFFIYNEKFNKINIIELINLFYVYWRLWNFEISHQIYILENF